MRHPETFAFNGLPGPRAGSPTRAHGSIRRTTSLTLTRPDGAEGPIEVWGRARDLHTDAAGGTHVLAHGLAHLRVDDGTVTYLTTAPVRPSTSRLVGRPALVGWRSALWRELRDDVETGSALHLLLDDLPGGMIVGGFTRRRALAAQTGGPVEQPGRRLGVCAGWAVDSRAARILADTGRPPPPVTPIAPSLVPDDDPVAWHTQPELPLWGLTRKRRIDVHPQPDGTVHVDAMFRDSFRDGDGHEKVLHEFAITSTTPPMGPEPSAESAGSGEPTIGALVPEPFVLPHLECPVAVDSAQLLVGMPFAELRDRVSVALYGPSSCTHLNDLARSLADVPALLAALGHRRRA